jgi:hypothetical protein
MPGQPSFLPTPVFARGGVGAKFTELLGRLTFDDEVLGWVSEALHASHSDQRRENEEAIRCLRTEHKRLGDRINAMYLDKLDGRVDTAFFDKMSFEWREEQNRCLERHASAEQSYMKKVCKFSNSHGMRGDGSSGRKRGENAVCSISYFRTVHGKMANWSPPFVNLLIF